MASEGPLPNKANEALREAVLWKSSPHLLTILKFQQVPLALKTSIAALLHVEADDIILGNSATYGLHLLSNGLNFDSGDEIILLQNDFPTDILPWLSLEEKGVVVHQLKSRNYVFTVQELEKAINKKTKLICLPFVHSFSGHKHDIHAISKLCRLRNVICVVNISQAAGAFDFDLTQLGADAVVCAGYKWLLGPYGTGFCWIKNDLRQKLNYPQNYWISLMDEESLNGEGEIHLKDMHSSRRYDVFGTANFFNYVPWQASIDYLLEAGLDKVKEHNQVLVDQIVDGLNDHNFDLISPCKREDRTNIIVFSYKDPLKNPLLFDFLKNKGYHLALWKNKLRVSPHIYNTSEQIGNFLTVLAQYASK